ncbi:MAG: sigma-70 family RNA polymerase sigma factor [Pirellulales bacterium]
MDLEHQMTVFPPSGAENRTPRPGNFARSFCVQFSEHGLSDDAPLIEATLAGDTAAFGQLVGRYQDRLYNSLFRVLGSAEDARDLVQDAFVQAFLKLNTFRGSSAFYTWLYRIAFNLAMSHTRKQRPIVSLDHAKDGYGREPIDGQPMPDAGLTQRERIEMVHTALAGLSVEYRQILVLRELDGCRYDEIAEILELPAGTVRSRLFRARLQLRDQLAPAMREEEIGDVRLVE